MRDWAGKEELVAKVAQAWRDAYATAPRDSNEHLEAAKFLAMLNAVAPLEEILGPAAPEAENAEPVALPSPAMVAEMPPEEDLPPDDGPDAGSGQEGTSRLPEVDYADPTG